MPVCSATIPKMTFVAFKEKEEDSICQKNLKNV